MGEVWLLSLTSQYYLFRGFFFFDNICLGLYKVVFIFSYGITVLYNTTSRNLETREELATGVLPSESLFLDHGAILGWFVHNERHF